ncbi:MAG TPA: ATP-binding protein [Candidatus Paceibacterota bacterium]|nr:ATP-binding protein [Candidatus Paceibacterota bacterium]
MTIFGLRLFHPLTKRQWRAAILLFIAYVAAMRVSAALFSAPGIIFPASGIALAGLYLEGFALWPVVFIASLVGYVLSGSSPVYMLLLPLAHTLQAIAGAWMLRRLGIDPLFRRMKDMLAMISVSFVASLIVPTIGTIARHLNSFIYNTPLSSVTWSSWYVATVFSLLIISPFLIRWFIKPRFSRNKFQVLEVLSAFGLLLLLSYFLFITPYTSLAGISLVYLLLIPLFWIALRLRPRFTTLALILLSCFAFAGIFLGANAPDPAEYGQRLFQTEIFLTIIAAIFFILTSLEEDRRMTTNLMRSQVSTLQNALERVASQDKAKSEFIAMLAHELRNPLAPIASSIDLLRLKSPKDQEQIELLNLMDNRMHTIKRLLDDLLDVSRIGENKLVLEKEQIEVSTVVRRAAASAEPYFQQRNQNLVLEMPGTEFVIEADPVRIEQVITNLLTNASKFSNPRDEIRLTVRQSGDMVEITVSDRGVGIDEDMLGRIFEPFLQVELGKRTRQGLGIGLALVRNLTEMHGGSVRVKSAGKGRGSQFTVLLPLVSKTPKRMREPEERVTPNRAPNGFRVLVVDDNDSAAWSIGRVLELQGYQIDYAYDGERALEKAQGFKPHAVLLDIGLPDMDGYEVGKALRGQGFSGRLIALSGYSVADDATRGKAAGFDSYLIKPASMSDLTRVLEGLA